MTDPADSQAPWVLRSLLDGGTRVWRVPLQRLPFRVGRKAGLDLTLPGNSVSTQHAEIYAQDGALRVRDLGSTNGTYVNRRRIAESEIQDGDVLHFADFEFRLEAPSGGSLVAPRETTAVLHDMHLPDLFVKGTRELHEMIRARQVAILFQPIVGVGDGQPVTFEALGRGAHPQLPEGPVDLFRIAENAGLAASLSQLLRLRALETARGHPRVTSVFLNTHPQEVGQPALAESLERLRLLAPELGLVIEIHESTVVGSDQIRSFRARLRELRIDLAYDDFGSGQARLLELAEVPPEYLKFDSRFIQGIAAAPESKQRLLRSLVAVARELGVRSIAEGLETEDDVRTCAQLGFELAQGYHFGRPEPIDRL